jgi:HSP20 family molecular chaperone IbpA
MITALDVFDALMSQRSFYFRPVRSLDERRSTFFKKEVADDKLTLSVDLPGVKPSDVEVSLEDANTIQITAKKNEKVFVDASCYVDDGFDAASAVPVLDLGVLKITFNKLPERETKKFTVLTA